MKKPLKIFSIHFVKTILTVLCLIHFLGENVIAQTTINAPDTIPYSLLDPKCEVNSLQRMNDIIITTWDQYVEADLRLIDISEESCPLPEIDFDSKILVIHKYNCSICDRGLRSALILRKGNVYNVKFSTHGNDVCRASWIRCIALIIPKPVGEFHFSFERVYEKVN